VTASFILQDGVPLSPIRRRPPARKRPWKEALSSATVGQFFFAEGRSPRSVSAYIARVSKTVEGKFETRRIWAWFDHGANKWRPCDQTAVGAKEGVGVWRVE
jgi:hypothetical protein